MESILENILFNGFIEKNMTKTTDKSTNKNASYTGNDPQLKQLINMFQTN